MIKYMATDAALREMLPGLDEMDPDGAASVRYELALRDIYARMKTPAEIAEEMWDRIAKLQAHPPEEQYWCGYNQAAVDALEWVLGVGTHFEETQA